MASASTTDEVFLDTSAWILLAEGAKRGVAGLDLRASTSCVLILAEVASLVERGRLPASTLAYLLESVRLEHPSVEDLVSAGHLHGGLRRSGNRKVSLSDCIMYRSAQRLGLPFVTADRDLAGHPGVILI